MAAGVDTAVRRHGVDRTVAHFHDTEVQMRTGYAPIGIIGTIVLIVLILWLLGAF